MTAQQSFASVAGLNRYTKVTLHIVLALGMLMRVTSFSTVSRPLPFVGSTSLQPASAPLPPTILQRQGLKVSNSQAEALIRRIEAQLNALENPSGFRRFIKRVYRKTMVGFNNQDPSIVNRAITKLAQKFMPEPLVPEIMKSQVIREWENTLTYLKKLKNLNSTSATTQIKLRYLDLSRLMLNGADFSNCKLTHCKFNKSALIGANFQGANLTGTSFKGAWLEWANFAFANLAHTFFDRAKVIPYNTQFIGIVNSKNNVQRLYFPTIFYKATGLDLARGLPEGIDKTGQSLNFWHISRSALAEAWQTRGDEQPPPRQKPKNGVD